MEINDRNKLTVIESIIDKLSVKVLLECMQIVCDEKAMHVQENWQDSKLAKSWQKDAWEIAKCADKVQN